MKGQVKLCNPIFLDGEEVGEVSYDFNEITLKDRIYIYKNAHDGSSEGNIGISEFDVAEHAWAFAFAASKAMPKSTPVEFMRLKGKDAIRAAELGRAFINLCSEERVALGGAGTGEREQSN